MRLDGTKAEFLKFCCVGAVCAFIDWSVYSLFCFIFPYQAAVLMGFSVSLIVNYRLTAVWTFKKKPTAGNFVGMVCAHLVNLFVVRMALLMLFVEILLLDERIAYIPTLLIAAITSFLMIRYVFKR